MGEDRSLAFFSKSCFKNTIFNFFFFSKKKQNEIVLNTTEF